jgi:hypothetical protein
VTLQQNAVHAELEGTMTDRQVLQKVVEMYKRSPGTTPTTRRPRSCWSATESRAFDDVYLRD